MHSKNIKDHPLATLLPVHVKKYYDMMQEDDINWFLESADKIGPNKLFRYIETNGDNYAVRYLPRTPQNKAMYPAINFRNEGAAALYRSRIWASKTHDVLEGIEDEIVNTSVRTNALMAARKSHEEFVDALKRKISERSINLTEAVDALSSQDLEELTTMMPFQG